MTTDRLATRRHKVLQSLRKLGISAVLVTNPKNVTYLTGFTGEDSYLILGPNLLAIFSDSRFEVQLQTECPTIPAEIRTSRTTMIDFLVQQVPKFGISNLGIEAVSMTVAVRDAMAEKLAPLELVALNGLVEELRQIKDPDEIDELKLAVKQAEQGYVLMRSLLVPEMTERQAAHELEHGMRRFGALKAAFEPIIAVGDRSALPHYRAGLRRFDQSPFVLCDWVRSVPRGITVT